MAPFDGFLIGQGFLGESLGHNAHLFLMLLWFSDGA
jgi:hypothetical protein